MGSGQSAPTLPSALTMPSPTSMTTSSLSPSSIAPPANKCTDPAYPEYDHGDWGEMCFQKCPDGYYRWRAACIPNGIPVPIKRDGSNTITPSPCPPGKILEGETCFTPCPKDTKSFSGYCFGDLSKNILIKSANVPK